jgi:hypothetical protein
LNSPILFIGLTKIASAFYSYPFDDAFAKDEVGCDDNQPTYVIPGSAGIQRDG